MRESAPRNVRILSAGRRHPVSRDEDRYEGVEVHVVLTYLRGEPIADARLSDQAALDLARSLITAVMRGQVTE